MINELKPWEIKDGHIVVAPESEWEKPIGWNKSATDRLQDLPDRSPKILRDLHGEFYGGELAHADAFRILPEIASAIEVAKSRPLIHVTTDVFGQLFKCRGCQKVVTIDHRGSCGDLDQYEGPIVNSKGERIRVSPAKAWVSAGPLGQETDGQRMTDDFDDLTITDLRTRLFQIIDSTPHVDYLLWATEPEKVEDVWPAYIKNYPSGARAHVSKHPNVLLGTPIKTQAQAEEQIPKLIPLRDLCKGLYLEIEPEEEIDLTKFMWSMKPNSHLPSGANRKDYIDYVRVGGGDKPTNIDWIRSIVKQCGDAGVRRYVTQLGSKIIDHRSSVAYTVDPEECWPDATCDHFYNTPSGEYFTLKDPTGSDPSEWPEDLRVREMPKFYGENHRDTVSNEQKTQ